ncbi:hypothetical protein GF373_03335, partial [bacterium]|nr:hypothetical protein [bacterium]
MLILKKHFILALFILLFSIPAFTQPVANIEFTSETLQADALQNFLVKGYATPDYQVDTFLTQDTFREGAQYTLQPGDAQLLVKNEPIKIANSPVVITLEFSVLQGSAEMAVVGFNAADGVLDGQLGFCQTTVGESSSPVQRLHVLYQAPDKSVLPGVQISKESGDAQPAKVVLYSLSVYEYTPETLSDINLQPSGTFEGDQKDYLVNINDDEGSVAFQQDPQNVLLDVAGGGQSANIGSQAAGLAEIASPSLLIAAADISKLSGGTGMSALVITDGSWRAVTFIHNQSLPQYPQAKTLITGGVHAPPNNPFYVFAQNGGGDAPSQTLIDNLEMEQLSLNSIQGLQAVRPFQVPESLAAALISPKSIYKGSQGSFSVLSMEQKTRKPVSAPYKLFLQSNDGKQEEITVNNSSTIVGSELTNKFAPGPADVSLKVYGKEVLSTQMEVKVGGVLFLETDKPIYKPGQTIQGRVILTNNALAPLQGEVELTVLDAKGIKIHKESLQTNTFGVASFELPLATELNFGTWKFQAKVGATNIEKDIVVDKYVLPAFEVKIDQKKDWFMSDEQITGVVESHFFFGKPVQGQVKIEALKYVSTWDKFAETTGRLENGRYAFELPAAGYLAGTPGAEGAGSVQLKISVTDDTGHTEKTDKLLTIVSSGLQIKLIPESPQIKPGFNQELLVVTESPEGTPLSTDISMDITFMAEDGSELGSIKDRVQTENGLALYQHEIPEKTHIAFVVASGEMDKRPADTTLVQNAVYSPGSHFIHLRQSDEKIYSTGETAVFDVFSTNQGTVYYDVFANGRTVFSHAVEGNKIVFQISPEMSPKAKLIAYMIQPNNEVSVDVLPFDVELNAPVSLQASFDAEEVKPGEPVNLSIQSEGQSMVGLSIVDESVFALAKGRLNLRNVFAELERIFMEPTIEIHEPDDPYQPEINTDAKGTADLLQEHNLQIVTTESLSVPKARETDPWRFWGRLPGRFIPLFPGQLEDATNYKGEGDTYKEPDRVRSFFPETWVWEPELKTDFEGQAALNLTAPDSITTWKLHAVSTSDQGMGITESELRVFQDFFAEPDLPYAVIRGDRFPLKVRLFNYVDQEQHIRVTLEDTEGLGLQDDPVQEIDLPANGIAAVEFTLQPNKVGIVPISIVAQSANRADAIRKNLRVEPEGAQRRMVFNGILNEASNETTVPIRYPEETVPDSQMLKINMTASMLGQTLSGLEDLLGMPFGCGEQNMIYLAPDVEVLRYFKATGQIMPEIRAKAETFIQTGYQ